MTQEEVEIVEHGLRSVVNTYGRLVAKDSNGRVVDSGSTVFVQLNGRKILATAHHVVCELFNKGKVFVQVFRQCVQDIEGPSPPIEYHVPRESIIDVRKNAEFDVSALWAPCDMGREPSIKWFVLDRHAAVLREHLRLMIQEERNPRLAGMILGFARFSRFESDEQKVQVAGSVPIWAILERISDPPSIASETRPQVVVELGQVDLTSLPDDAPPLVVSCFQNFRDMVGAEEHPLGGYSGAPLMYFCEQGPFLVGIMKEAGMRLGGQGFATPIDVFFECIRDVPNQSATS